MTELLQRNHSHTPQFGLRHRLALAVLMVLSIATGLLSLGFPRADVDTVSLIDGTVKPQKVSSATKPVERGVLFSSSRAGDVVGLRVLSGAEADACLCWLLWAPIGELLGRVEFAESSIAGWQTARFSSPVQIAAGGSYVASYLDSNGRFAVTRGGFAQGRIYDGLTVPIKGGPYQATRSSVMPTHRVASNYLVDVVFRPLSGSSQSGVWAGCELGRRVGVGVGVEVFRGWRFSQQSIWKTST